MGEIRNIKINGDAGNYSVTNDIFEGREVAARLSKTLKEIPSEVTIMIQSYNKFEKTKRCVESVLKYTEGIDYDLLLVDNGSDTEEIFEYYKQVPYEKKTIIRIKANLGSIFPLNYISSAMVSDYFVSIPDDCIVTKNWLSNMLAVMKSDDRIGMVNPLTDNTSNLQNHDLHYSDYDEMQELAAKFNVSDPTKWEERIRLVTLGSVYRKSCLLSIGMPNFDVGFVHEFGDDDISFRIRRMGYKIILAGDTWICHDHPGAERKDNLKGLIRNLDLGKEIFKEKYYGIDPWDDSNDYIRIRVENHVDKTESGNANILGVDVKCGMAVLEIKNLLRKKGVFDTSCYAFSTDEKYEIDLRSICGENVVCGREELIKNGFGSNMFDYAVILKEINRYNDPLKVVTDVYSMLKPGGRLFITLKNVYSADALLYMLGDKEQSDIEYCRSIQFDSLITILKEKGMKATLLAAIMAQQTDPEFGKTIAAILESWAERNKDDKEMITRLLTKTYWMMIEK